MIPFGIIDPVCCERVTVSYWLCYNVMSEIVIVVSVLAEHGEGDVG